MRQFREFYSKMARLSIKQFCATINSWFTQNQQIHKDNERLCTKLQNEKLAKTKKKLHNREETTINDFFYNL